MSGVVFDLYEFMPGHGENSLSIQLKGQELDVVVGFDSEGTQKQKVITFSNVSFHSVGAFPGIASISGKCKFKFATGCVIEAEESDLSDQWNEHWRKNGLERKSRHYVMFFSAENKAVHVIAEGCHLD